MNNYSIQQIIISLVLAPLGISLLYTGIKGIFTKKLHLATHRGNIPVIGIKAVFWSIVNILLGSSLIVVFLLIFLGILI